MQYQLLTPNAFIQDLTELAANFNNTEHSVNEIISCVVQNLKKEYEKKYVYKEFVNQMICHSLEQFELDNGFVFELDERAKERAVEYLNTLELPEQRSLEWHLARWKMITASETASVFGKSPYKSKNKYLQGKSQPIETLMNKKWISNKWCDHGIKFEPVVQDIVYPMITGNTIVEYGCIPHPRINFVGASPDGITPNGVMVEIKCPLSRQMIGIPPIYYWIQMQQQLQVCNLNQCDYVECKFIEYANYNEFIADKQTTNKLTGIVLECVYRANNELKHHYIYQTQNELSMEPKEWMRENFAKIPDGYTFSRYCFWKLDTCYVTPIYRDDEWWDDSLPKMHEFWQQVLACRTDPSQLNITPSRPRRVFTNRFVPDEPDEPNEEGSIFNSGECLINTSS